jgi:hypothetical protein
MIAKPILAHTCTLWYHVIIKIIVQFFNGWVLLPFCAMHQKLEKMPGSDLEGGDDRQ